MSCAPYYLVVHSNEAVTTAQVVRKASLRLMPFVCLLYFFNYLDRVNIGFAGPNGMNAELGMSASAFGFVSGIFFLGYLLLEVPSNLALHRFGARRWLARIMITWGVLATLMAFVPNPTTMGILRFLLGVAEAGFFPGIILYLTFWFPAAERARAVAMFMTAIPISTAIGSTLSSVLISSGNGVFGLSGWRFMFLVEGLPAIIMAVATWFYLTDRPGQAKWLTATERQVLIDALETERKQTEAKHHWSLLKSLVHPRILALAFVYFGITYGNYALQFFLPTIVAGFRQQYGLHLTTVQAGLVTSIPYVIAAIAMVAWGAHGDRTQERMWHVALPLLVGGVSIPVALYLGNPVAAMTAVTICAVGVNAAVCCFWALPSNFLSGVAAAGGIALINSLGNLSGFLAPSLTGLLRDATGSQKAGLWLVGVVMVIAVVAVLLLRAAPRPSTAEEVPTTSGDAVTG